MKNVLISLKEKILLRKRSIIETVFDSLNPNYGLNKEIKVQLRRGKQGKLEYFSNN